MAFDHKSQKNGGKERVEIQSPLVTVYLEENTNPCKMNEPVVDTSFTTMVRNTLREGGGNRALLFSLEGV